MLYEGWAKKMGPEKIHMILTFSRKIKVKRGREDSSKFYQPKLVHSSILGFLNRKP